MKSIGSYAGEVLARLRPKMKARAYEEQQVARGNTPDGRYEVPDPTPVEAPVLLMPGDFTIARMRELIRSEQLARELAALEREVESFDEADDFDVPDDPFPTSGYENDPELEPEIPEAETTGVPTPSGGGEGAGGKSKKLPPAPPAAPSQLAEQTEEQ